MGTHQTEFNAHLLNIDGESSDLSLEFGTVRGESKHVRAQDVTYTYTRTHTHTHKLVLLRFSWLKQKKPSRSMKIATKNTSYQKTIPRNFE